MQTSAGVPFLLQYPHRVKAGKVVETAHSSVNFATTILSLMGVEDPGVEFQGIDGSEELVNSDMISSRDNIVFSMDYRKRRMWAAAIKNGYKLVIGASGIPWLFGLDLDPDKTVNLIESSKCEC